jgi:hypothetical protein
LLPSVVAFLIAEALLLAVKHVCLSLRPELFRKSHLQSRSRANRGSVADRHAVEPLPARESRAARLSVRNFSERSCSAFHASIVVRSNESAMMPWRKHLLDIIV